MYDEGEKWLTCECEESNKKLIASIRQDANEEALHEIALDDWMKGRMTKPKCVAEVDTSQARAFPLFHTVCI